jgi:PPM family protein phosphatase
MAAAKRITCAAESHPGLVRSDNEDSFSVYKRSGDKNILLVVCDGIGGHHRGDLASSCCCRNMVTAWKRRDAGNMGSSKDMQDFLDNCVKSANCSLFQQNNQLGVNNPMGTTIVCAVIMESHVVSCHAGDSRLYRLRDDVFEQLTSDHSVVQELINRKLMTPEQAVNHPLAHVISRSVGPTEDVIPEINLFDRKAGDRLLLCSDGLTLHVKDPMLKAILRDSKTPRDAIDEMMKQALIGGGEDNVTTVCAFC